MLRNIVKFGKGMLSRYALISFNSQHEARFPVEKMAVLLPTTATMYAATNMATAALLPNLLGARAAKN